KKGGCMFIGNAAHNGGRDVRSPIRGIPGRSPQQTDRGSHSAPKRTAPPVARAPFRTAENAPGIRERLWTGRAGDMGREKSLMEVGNLNLMVRGKWTHWPNDPFGSLASPKGTQGFAPHPRG